MTFRPKAIVVHCSASSFGDAETFRQWHLERGWSDIGYHAVILNGDRGAGYSRKLDGKIEPGRPESKPGAHCKAGNMNAKALGVCLVGDPTKAGRASQSATLASASATWRA